MPAGLALSALELRNEHRLQEVIIDVHAKAVATWPHPQADRPRGGRPDPPRSISRPGFASKTSTPTLTAYNRHHVLHLVRTDLGRL